MSCLSLIISFYCKDGWYFNVNLYWFCVRWCFCILSDVLCICVIFWFLLCSLIYPYFTVLQFTKSNFKDIKSIVLTAWLSSSGELNSSINKYYLGKMETNRCTTLDAGHAGYKAHFLDLFPELIITAFTEINTNTHTHTVQHC